MKKLYYPAKFFKEKRGYFVKFIDFENVFTQGNTLEEAYYMAQDALYGMLDEYDKLPKPTLNYMNIKDEDGELEFITLVELDLLLHRKRISSKSVKTTVTMPEWLKSEA